MPASSSTFPACRSTTIGSTVTDELICRSRCAAAIALGVWSFTSCSSNSAWRCRLVEFHDVAIDNAKMPDAGPDQMFGHDASKGAAADQKHRASQQAAMPGGADLGKKRLTVIAIHTGSPHRGSL